MDEILLRAYLQEWQLKPDWEKKTLSGSRLRKLLEDFELICVWWTWDEAQLKSDFNRMPVRSLRAVLSATDLLEVHQKLNEWASQKKENSYPTTKEIYHE